MTSKVPLVSIMNTERAETKPSGFFKFPIVSFHMEDMVAMIKDSLSGKYL